MKPALTVIEAKSEASPENGKSEELLDSWKEIAAFLNRGIRTVQRWEREEGLPVHRHDHNKRSTVFAFRSEIQYWMVRRGNDDAPAATITRYSNLDSAELVARCMKARCHAEKVRRVHRLIYEYHQAEIVRLQAKLKGISPPKKAGI